MIQISKNKQVLDIRDWFLEFICDLEFDFWCLKKVRTWSL